MRRFAISYGVWIPAVPEFQLSNSQNAIRPCASTPLLTSITPAGRKYAHANSSARVHTSFTGRPAALASRAAGAGPAAAPRVTGGGPPRPPSPSGFSLRYVKIVRDEGWPAGTFHVARTAAVARFASRSVGATTPAKSPSWTTVTPGIFVAPAESSVTSVAP